MWGGVGESIIQGPNLLFKFFTKYSEPIQPFIHPSFNLSNQQVTVNQHAKIKHSRSTHDTMIYVETQFGKNHQ